MTWRLKREKADVLSALNVNEWCSLKVISDWREVGSGKETKAICLCSGAWRPEFCVTPVSFTARCPVDSRSSASLLLLTIQNNCKKSGVNTWTDSSHYHLEYVIRHSIETDSSDFPQVVIELSPSRLIHQISIK